MRTLPFKLPSAYVLKPGAAPTLDVDTGGYDFMLGGHGFRLATDQKYPYQRLTEPTTTHRYDSSLEPGEQSLSPIPWIKAQSSFHAGAGQLNLEQGFTAFEYQQEKVEHIRFDTSLGVNVWTPGQVTRLPDSRPFGVNLSNATCMVTANVNGVDYAVIGGNGLFYQVAWSSGPDADPVVTPIDMSNTAFGGLANCNITSLCTDGINYYAVVQLTTVGYVAGVLTYIVSGSCASAAGPTALYECPATTALPTRTNLCTNPSFETNLTGWSAGGSVPPTITQSVAQAYNRSHSMLITWGTGGSLPQVGYTVTGLTVGATYTVSLYAFVPSGGSPGVVLNVSNGGTLSGQTTTTNAFQRIQQTWQAGATSASIQVWPQSSPTAGQTAYVDAVQIELGAVATPYFDGASATDSSYTYAWSGTADASTSVATGISQNKQTPSVVGWQKARLVAGVGQSFYELSPTATPHSALPTPRYTHPTSGWTWTATSESPTGVLAAGKVGNASTVLEFTLDNAGGTPFLSGGASVAVLPAGELLYSMEQIVGSFLAVGTNDGIRVGTFDTYTGALKLGPVSVTTTSPVYDLTSRDRFVFGAYSNQQADGTTGLVRVDLSMVVDAAGRNAWAPDLRPATTATSRTGTVRCAGALPGSGRVVYTTPAGLHVEGASAGSDGDAWLRTSRIRWGTAEMKLFKLGRIHGSLDVANIQVTGIAPYGVSSSLGTFGFISGKDPGEFRLPTGLNEWIQLQFDLQGSACVFNSYQAKAIPAPKRQHIITLTALCFRNEVDRFGLEVTDPETPRTRYQNVRDMEASGNEVRFVEFTNQGAVAELVVIDQIDFESYSPPNIDDDFGGYLTMKLRTTES